MTSSPPQRALFVQGLEELDRLGPGHGFSRLHAGVEFCQELLPGPETLTRLLRRARALDLPLTLVTPLVTDAGLPRVESLLSLFLADHPEGEVVVNDWGVLRLLRREHPGARPTLGRLLAHQRKDPRLWRDDAAPPAGATSPAPDSRPAADLLRRLGVRRMELDPLPGGRWPRPPERPALPCSVHQPHALLSLTRYCPVADREGLPAVAPTPCPRPCEAGRLRLEHDEFPGGLGLRGNALFYRSEPRDAPPAAVDRIVHHLAGVPR